MEVKEGICKTQQKRAGVKQEENKRAGAIRVETSNFEDFGRLLN